MLLETARHCVIVSAGLAEKPLHRPGQHSHSLGQVLSIAAHPGLYQQGLRIGPAVFPPLLSPEKWQESPRF